jgi:GMP synthase (glutamine-hydrolysing)
LSLIQNSLQTFDTKALQTVLLPVKSVGVQGDGRTYSYAVGLRGKPDWLALREKAQEIPKKIHTINRVAYIFTSSATQKKQVPQITPTFLDTAVVEQLRQAEQIVLEVLYKEKLLQSISQFPVILLPVSFDQPGERSVVLRPFMTNDFMTGMPAIPGKDISLDALEQIVSRILTSVPGISAVLYDLTSKPPGTTEWE